MKNRIINIIVFSILLCSTACTDFLTEETKSEMNTSQYFATPDHARAAVNNLYRAGVPAFLDAGSAHYGATIMLNGYLSGFYDNEFKGMSREVRDCQTLQITADGIASSLDKVWQNGYIAIARANTVIKYIGNTPGLSSAELQELLAQAKFFRAYNYLYLVKFFGDVPLITEPYESLDNLYVARTASEEVYKQITDDLTESANGLKDACFTENGFRVTKATAEIVLADAYLNMSGYPLKKDNYANAAKAARSIINTGKHALLENGKTPETSAYNMIRTLDDSKEYIYSREYMVGIADNGWRPTYSLPYAMVALGIFKYGTTNNIYRPLNEILNIYDPENDLRIQEKQFFHTSLTYVKDGMEETVTFETAPYLWYEEEALFQTGKGGKDVAVYRYAEALLIAAEAIAQSEGVTAEAVEYLAQVRIRAYTQMDKSDIVDNLASLTKENFIKEVWKERLREFILENKIWDDIQRTRMYPVTSESKKGEVDFIDVIGAKNPWGATFQEKHLLWPISANEIQRNPSLIQNAGY